MIIALNSKATSVGDIPFPAVTICKYIIHQSYWLVCDLIRLTQVT